MEFIQAGQYQMGVPMERQMGMDGFQAMRSVNDARLKRRVSEAARLYADALEGKVDPWFVQQAMNPTNDMAVTWLAENYPGLYGKSDRIGLKETMSVTDYQALYVDVLDRIYYGFYNAYPIPNKPLVKIHGLRDFRLVSRYLLDGMVTPLTAMDAAAPPPQRALYGPTPQDGATYGASTSTAPLQYQPLLYQAMASVNWRAMVNDDLGIFKDIAQRLAIAGNRGIHKFITTFYVSTTGLNTTLYQAGYRNLVTTAYGAASNNPALSAQGLSDALKVLANMRDSGGDPIMITGTIYLWYGPALVATANNLMNMMNVFLTTEGGNAGTAQPAQFVNTNNWLVQGVKPIMDPYIPIVASGASGNIANTIWGLTVDPNSQNRPNTEVGFLNGYETPQLFQKLPNTQRLGGGVDSMLGDFYTMDSDIKVVTVMGGVNIDGRSTVCSTGAGT